tara:strand:+ start:288 stop:590 length:303 start_codon:yes stop_codon:yes gene_type:complete
MAMRGTPGHLEGLVPVAGSATLSVGGSDVAVVEVTLTAVDDVAAVSTSVVVGAIVVVVVVVVAGTVVVVVVSAVVVVVVVVLGVGVKLFRIEIGSPMATR